nr:protein exportin 1A [Tanacetum cinerariifolium]
TRTRRLISILKENWKDVTKEEKNFLWSDIKVHFRLENDDVKKQTLLSRGTKWKAFKTRLRVKFMLKNVSPLMKWTHIEPNVWDQFCQNENTAAKNKLRAEAHARGQKQITRPRVGPKGYRGFEKQWEEERIDPDKATELHLILNLHSSNYCLARAPRDKVGIKPLPAELINVSKKLAQVASELSQSSNESKSGVDPLIMEETYDCLYVPSSALVGQQVICATATIYPILGDESAVNGFIQWTIFAIGRYKGTSKPPVTEIPTKRLMPQHERAPSSKKGKAENEKAANRKRLQDLENDILTKP